MWKRPARCEIMFYDALHAKYTSVNIPCNIPFQKSLYTLYHIVSKFLMLLLFHLMITILENVEWKQEF